MYIKDDSCPQKITAHQKSSQYEGNARSQIFDNIIIQTHYSKLQQQQQSMLKSNPARINHFPYLARLQKSPSKQHSNLKNQLSKNQPNTAQSTPKLVLTLVLEVPQYSLTKNYEFTYYEDTQIADLMEFVKQCFSQENMYWKARDPNLQYLLGLHYMKLQELSVSKIQLTAAEIKNDQEPIRNVTVLNYLGSGGFSKVYMVTLYANVMAMKVINKTNIRADNREAMIDNQRNILQQCSGHPFIPQFHMVFESENYLMMCIEYCHGGDLFHLLQKKQRLSEDEARFYFLEIVAAISYLHSKQIIYRDLKPENVVIDVEGHIRLTDFGLSRVLSDETAYSFCGSAEYMAPEMILKQGHSFQLDLYSLGALLYQLVCGSPPFYSQSEKKLLNNIVSCPLKFPSHIDLSPAIQDLLKRLLEKDPQQRYQRISNVMNHDWLAGITVSDVLNKKLKPPYVPSLFSSFEKVDKQAVYELEKEKLYDSEDNRSFIDLYYESSKIRKIRNKVDNVRRSSYPEQQLQVQSEEQSRSHFSIRNNSCQFLHSQCQYGLQFKSKKSNKNPGLKQISSLTKLNKGGQQLGLKKESEKYEKSNKVPTAESLDCSYYQVVTPKVVVPQPRHTNKTPLRPRSLLKWKSKSKPKIWYYESLVGGSKLSIQPKQ